MKDGLPNPPRGFCLARETCDRVCITVTHTIGRIQARLTRRWDITSQFVTLAASVQLDQLDIEFQSRVSRDLAAHSTVSWHT